MIYMITICNKQLQTTKTAICNKLYDMILSMNRYLGRSRYKVEIETESNFN